MDHVLTVVRLIPLPIHAALRMATGLLTMVIPFIVGFGPAATVVAAVVGAVVTGVALTGITDERGLTALPVSTIHAFDYASALGLLGLAGLLGFDGDLVATVTLSAIALVWLVGNMLTRYSLRA